jgi:hypothetical protein
MNKETSLNEQVAKQGREMDALVAERVMGWRWLKVIGCRNPIFMPPEQLAEYLPEYVKKNVLSYDGNPPSRLPHYSTDITAAFHVIEHLRQQSMMLSVSWGNDGGWWCVIYPETGSPVEGDYAETAAEAICLAALRACRGE